MGRNSAGRNDLQSGGGGGREVEVSPPLVQEVVFAPFLTEELARELAEKAIKRNRDAQNKFLLSDTDDEMDGSWYCTIRDPMFFLAKPSDERIHCLLNVWRKAPFNYSEVGQSLGKTPTGYAANHGRIRLGDGEATFNKAVEALRSWKMFDLGWVSVCRPDAKIEVGTTVAVLARHFGFWSLHPARIVFLIDDDDGQMRRSGFAYGTVKGHGEQGEETFIIEWRHADGGVWYDLRSFSKPGQLLTALGYPLARMLQKRFAQDSTQSMFRAVGEGRGD